MTEPAPQDSIPANLLFWEITQRNGLRVALSLAHVGTIHEVPEGTDVVTANGGAFATSLTFEEALRQIADLRAGLVPAPEPPPPEKPAAP